MDVLLTYQLGGGGGGGSFLFQKHDKKRFECEKLKIKTFL